MSALAIYIVAISYKCSYIFCDITSIALDTEGSEPN